MNQQNAESAFLTAKARFESFQQRIQGEWAMPVAETAATLAWQNADPIAKTSLAQYAPAEFDKIQKKFGGKNG